MRLPKTVKSKQKKKPLGFSKTITIITVAILLLYAIAPVILSWYDKQPLESLSGIIVGGCFAQFIGYMFKSLAEKHSRNKHGLDEDGNPWNNEKEEEHNES